jgi:hypothetical protein
MSANATYPGVIKITAGARTDEKGFVKRVVTVEVSRDISHDFGFDVFLKSLETTHGDFDVVEFIFVSPSA